MLTANKHSVFLNGGIDYSYSNSSRKLSWYYCLLYNSLYFLLNDLSSYAVLFPRCFYNIPQIAFLFHGGSKHLDILIVPKTHVSVITQNSKFGLLKLQYLEQLRL